MATKWHPTLTGSDSHVNKIEATAGIELTTPSAPSDLRAWVSSLAPREDRPRGRCRRCGRSAFGVTLPSASDIVGRRYTIMRTNSGSNDVTVGCTGGQPIDG